MLMFWSLVDLGLYTNYIKNYMNSKILAEYGKMMKPDHIQADSLYVSCGLWDSLNNFVFALCQFQLCCVKDCQLYLYFNSFKLYLSNLAVSKAHDPVSRIII